MDPALWLTFAGASLVLAVAPGPDNLFVLAQSAVYGVRAGLTVVLGLCTGLVVQTICAACGLAAVVAAVPALFWGIRIAGACYLIYLAWMAWTHAVSDSEGPQGTALTGMALWRRGVIMNITNPKVQIFFLTIKDEPSSSPILPGLVINIISSSSIFKNSSFEILFILICSSYPFI